MRPPHACVTLTLALFLAAGSVHATDTGFTTILADGEEVTIYRDSFGVPHIFAESNRALFEAYGYVVAQDRLWQLELNRRAARGRLAEVFGAAVVAADRAARILGYTDAELDAQFAQLSDEEQEVFVAYASGINRYLAELASAPPRVPAEFYAAGFTPGPWTIRDSVAFGAFMVRRFGEIGGRELTNAAVLQSLVAMHGPADGYAVFNDLRWINDPDSPVTVPRSGAVGDRQKTAGPALSQQVVVPASADDLMADAKEIWESLGVPTRLGSYAWVVSAARSAEGYAMLYGGPQMGFSAPEVLHEVQLHGGNGFNVTGMAFAGVPQVLIGRNEHVAWTSTTATGDNVDHYVETLCDAGAGTVFAGACRPFESRTETIAVRGGPPVVLQVLRTVHGPVVATGAGVVFSQKRAHWLRELESVRPFFAFDRARNLSDFADAVPLLPTSHNFLYADKVGNIAYWQAGQVPVRPAGFDTRLPLPGDGSAEWPGGLLPIPTSINPVRGYLANWNNKPSAGYDNADNQTFGKQFRLSDIDDRLGTGMISLADMRDIPRDIARVKAIGREARHLEPYLLAALDAAPPAHPLAAQARALLEAWDGSAFADAVSSTQLLAGEVIFSSWLSRMIVNTFADELGSVVQEAGTNTLIHVLDFALTGASGVPPSRDYLNGADANAFMSQTFDEILAALAVAMGPDPSAWTAPRGVTSFNHPLFGSVGTTPASNRATYAQIVVLSRPKIQSENIFTLGQSGFVQFVPPGGFAFSPHFRDQLPLYRSFEYKPMPLYRNKQLKE